MKRALIIAYDDLNNSGVPNVIYQTIKALHEDYSFDVLIFGDDEYYYQKLLADGIRINLIKCIIKKPKSKVARLFWWYFKRPHTHYLFMKRLLKKTNYSVIHSFKEYDCWPFLKAAKEFDVKKRIFHCNVNLSFESSVKNKLLFLRNRRLSLKYSNVYVGVSELSCKSAFMDKPYSVLYSSFDEDKYNENIRNSLLDDELVITQTGYYSENKNQLFSLQVIKELKQLYNNARLKLVGMTDRYAYYEQLVNYVKTNKLEDSVSFFKRTSDVDKIYEETTFSIIPSFREGFSLVAVESQACGIDVFASSNISEEVNCGGVRYLDLSKGPAYWANCIYEIFLKHRNRRTKYNVDKFSFDKFKDRLSGLYNDNLVG